MYIKISHVFVFCILLSSGYVFSQSDTAKPDLFQLSFEELMDIKVKGVSKKSELLIETPMSVTLVTREEMKTWGVRSLYEVLGRVPGYNFYYTDFYGQFGVIGRGMSSVWRYSMGFEFLELDDFGHYLLTPNFFKNSEIARGPAGLTWGGNAEAGLINFNIRDDLDGAEIHTQIGNKKRFSSDILIGNQFEKKGDGFFFGFHYEQQDYETLPNNLGIFPADSFPIKMNGINPSWSMLARYKKEGFKFIFFKDHSDHITPHIWDWNSDVQKTYFDSLAVKNGDMHDEFETIALRGEYNFFHHKNTSDLVLFAEYYHRHWFINGIASINQRRYTAGFNYRRSLLDNNLEFVTGGDVISRTESNDPSNNHIRAVQANFNWFENNYFPTYDEYSNLYAQFDYKFLKKFLLIAGSRLDYQWDESLGMVWSGPRLGFIAFPTNEITFKVLYNKTKRLPGGNEIIEGSKTSPEYLNVVEFVAMYNSGNKINASITAFYQELEDQIFKRIGGDHSGFINGGGIKSQGIEWNIKFRPTNKMSLRLNGHVHNSEAVMFTFDSVPYSVPQLSDGRLPFSPEISNFVSYGYHFIPFLSGNIALRSIVNIPYTDIDLTEKETSVSFIDLSFQTKHFYKEKFKATLNIINLLNNQKNVPAFGEHFQNSNGTIKPEGIRILLGLELKL